MPLRTEDLFELDERAPVPPNFLSSPISYVSRLFIMPDDLYEPSDEILFYTPKAYYYNDSDDIFQTEEYYEEYN